MDYRGRWSIILAVATLHVALLWSARQSSPWPERGAPAPAAPVLDVRAIAPPPSTAPPPTRLPPRALRLPTREPWPWPDIMVRPELPGIAPEPAEPAAPAAISAPSPTPPASAAPLDLHLPRAVIGSPGVRQQALDDPRANTAPKTIESRIRAAVGTDGPLSVEDLGEGRKRYRRGTRCVEVHDARIASIDPFNESVRPSPKQARACD